jgi:hypothetical protein
MKRIAFFLLILLSTVSFGQKITTSQEILSSTDPEITSAKDFWIEYILAISKCNDSNKEVTYLKYWNQVELKQGFTDIVNEELPVYSFGELVILSIKKDTNGFFQIRNKLLVDDVSGKSTYALFNIYIKKEASGFKLYNQFYLTKNKLQQYNADNINFYYPKTYNFNIKKANEIANFYSKYSAIYGNLKIPTLTYIVGNDFNEANKIIGFDSSIVTSTSPFAGYSIKNQKIILSCRVDHLHEIIHGIFFNMFPNAPSLFQEGIATYYGGTGGENYSLLISQLKELINNKPDIDLSNFDKLNVTLGNGTNNFYTIEAIIIDYALKNGGPKKVISLFQYSISSEVNSEVTLRAISNELGIASDQIDSFLKKYIHAYQDK